MAKSINALPKSINTILMVLAAVLLVPTASYAAGLGTITVRSALGQPLDAEIEVVALHPGEDIQVRLATREAYQNAGIDLSPALQGARFAVERRDGRTVIRVRTSQPVNDPFFSVLVELQTPTGRLSRQYTVLVDPAEYKIASTPAQQTAAAASPATVAPAPAAAPPRTQAESPKVAAATTPSIAQTAPSTVAAAPTAPVAPISAAAPAPTPVVATAPAPAVAEQPIVVAQPIAVPAPTAPASAVSETSRPAVVAAQPAPAPVQAPAVVAAPVLAEASTAAGTRAAEPMAAKPSVESAPAPSVATSTSPVRAPVQPTAVAVHPQVQPIAAPSATPQAAAPPAPARQAPSQEAVVPGPVARVAPPPPAAAASVHQNADVSDAYRIRRGDTLGAIARKWKPDGVSYEQMLVGLYQTNRPVFIHDNINLIRAGATLFIPSRDDVLAISAADAARQVRTHMAAFTKYRDSTVSAGAGSERISQAQREVIGRRVGVKRSTRAM